MERFWPRQQAADHGGRRCRLHPSSHSPASDDRAPAAKVAAAASSRCTDTLTTASAARAATGRTAAAAAAAAAVATSTSTSTSAAAAAAATDDDDVDVPRFSPSHVGAAREGARVGGRP